ncbi:hypothetical protein [Mucilaginibacter arboris]|uniref:Uncharacterized protein n=1 Tax=Mucilaginibacter arboris TaxID=2682090 RepID=A0A7K1SSF6_9SPHI|nr:hypothetical protein [Mucilaginibacter arboris]MVN20177.1 hypothetical protein [Mucilaginibacter arboris]
MKFLKVIVIALITVFAFNNAEAQIRVKVGDNPRRHRKVVVVERRTHHVPHHRYVVVKRYHH